MILQSLVDLYERRCASEDPEQRLPEPGWEDGEIDITLILNTQGKLIQVHDLRRPNKRGKFVGRPTPVPEKAPGRTSNPGPNLLWDKAEFVLGMVDPKAAEKDRAAAAKRAAKRFNQ
jgi:CRISPR-associated protein Csd1